MFRQVDLVSSDKGGGDTAAPVVSRDGRVPPETSPLERLLYRPVPLWLLLLVIVLGAGGLIAFGAVVDGWQKSGALGRAAIQTARLPDTIKRSFEGSAPYFRGQYPRLPAGFWRNPAQGLVDPGYALVSPYDPERGRSVVRLIRLSDGATLRDIVPDVDAANARSRFTSALTDVRRDKDAPRNRLMHPLLLSDGSIVVHDSSPLARYDPCGRLMWSLDGIFTHSTERGPDGTLWVPYRHPRPTEPGVRPTFWDDAVANVSPDGTLLSSVTVAAILERNGLGHLWRGRPYSDDPFHLNDIQPVMADGPHWRRGDVFLSLRNLSMVALYRPATGRILWWRVLPWRFQHDVTILDDHRISVFDNNVLMGYPREAVNGTNRLLVQDFAKGVTTSPYAEAFRRNAIATRAQGRGTPLPDGDAIVEETEQGRLLRVAPDGTVRWRYISADAQQRRFALAWARYLDSSTDGTAIQKAMTTPCV
ncbi:arylsulfotransferase family protein [Sphingomonas hengshuiensis]|nr:arylsulfotransferase family protein [Sphingomonas hengshuiensis]